MLTLKTFSFQRFAVLYSIISTLQVAVFCQNSSCEQAIAITSWVLDQADTNTAAQELLGEAVIQYEEQQPSTSDLIQVMPQLPWVAFQVQALLGATAYGGAEPGEIFNVVNRLNSSDLLGNLTQYEDNVLDVFDIWRDSWVDLANRLVAAASNDASQLSDEAKASMLYRASQYYFISQWPFPVSEGGLRAAENSTKAFDDYLTNLETSRGYTVEYLDIPFSNGTVSVDLPGVFITPDPTKKLPLVILNTGTDYPKEAIFPFGGSQSLENGYAVLIFDGPGQGQVKRQEPYMPLVPDWETVIESVLSEVKSNENVQKYVSLDDIVLWGVSLGGYLVGKACSVLPKDSLKACIVTPAVVSMIPPYANGLIEKLFLPMAKLNSSDIPEGFAGALQNSTTVVDKILRPLLQECDDDSAARSIWTTMFDASPDELIDVLPDYVYSIMDYAGIVTSNVTEIIDATYLGYQGVLNFTNTDISATQIPILVLSGTQDNLMGGQEEEYFNQLPQNIQDVSKLVNFTAETGGALHSQSGALQTQAEAVFPWLKETLGNAAPSPTSSSTYQRSDAFPLTAVLISVLLHLF
ncbi:hypothetical protein M9435_000355 [Picochlorum sp. BPE23]|nr:hypothetical protein M9435_000355 [Picochlorum sp. BPE23]